MKSFRQALAGLVTSVLHLTRFLTKKLQKTNCRQAHLNLRGHYLPYKALIAEVIMDKNPGIRTVINKIDDVGTESEYRTFSFELLAGDPDMEVETKKERCTFRFDYSKVYWNPRLDTEHHRLVDRFQPGEAVCDVMAGVGPFAVPAGKKKVFVWANDLNPESYKSLQVAIDTNKVCHIDSWLEQATHFSCRYSEHSAGAEIRSSFQPRRSSLHSLRSSIPPPHQHRSQVADQIFPEHIAQHPPPSSSKDAANDSSLADPADVAFNDRAQNILALRHEPARHRPHLPSLLHRTLRRARNPLRTAHPQ